MINNIYNFRNEAFVIREADNEMVLVPLSDNIVDMTNIMTLNDVATDVVNSLDGKKTVREICETLLEKYDVEKDVLERDVLNFVEEAVRRKIIEL